MHITLLGIVMLVRAEQSLKAFSPMVLTSPSKTSVPTPFSYVLERSIAPKVEGSVLFGKRFDKNKLTSKTVRGSQALRICNHVANHIIYTN